MTQNQSSYARELYVSFWNKQENARNTAIQTAQQLVNLFRHLPHFGDDFIQTFNQRVMSMPPDVQMALSDLVGGPAVRQYADYLKARHGINAESTLDSNQIDETARDGWLPDPENDFGAIDSLSLSNAEKSSSQTSGTLGSGGAHRLKKLMQTLIAMQQNESMKQTAFLQAALQQLQEGLSRQLTESMMQLSKAIPSLQKEKGTERPKSYPRGSFCKREDRKKTTWVPSDGEIEIVSDEKDNQPTEQGIIDE